MPGRAPLAGLTAGSPLAVIAGRAVAAAGRAWAAAAERRRHDAAAGGCAHGLASAAYRPPPRVAALHPGTFRWTTPAGRTYTTRPDPYIT